MLDLKREYCYLKADIDQAIERVLEQQNWILGPEVKELEKRVADYIGTRFAVGVASGTDALVLALRALVLKLRGREYFTPEDEIITTSFTFTATGDAIIRAGATPVFVDITPATYNIAPEQVVQAITERTVGIVPVHLYGQACALDRLTEIATEHRLFIVEDVAQAFGATFLGRRCGAWGTAAAFSFFPSKNLGGFGDGGMVTTNDEALAHYVDVLRRHGGRDKYNVDLLGYNSRLDTIQAAVLLTKLNYVEEFNRRRKAIAQRYSTELAQVAGIVPPVAVNGEHVFHQYTIRCPNRDSLKKGLAQRGIASMVYYPVPLHKMTVFRGRCRIGGSLAHAERAANEVLSLPIAPLLLPAEQEQVIEAVREVAPTSQ